MLHLILLVGTMISATIACKILSYSMESWHSWTMRRIQQLLGLFMPFSVLLFFSLMNLPAIIARPQSTLFDQNTQFEWLAGMAGLLCLLIVFSGALFLNLFRLGLLWLYVWRRSWPAPATFQNKLEALQLLSSRKKKKKVVQLRIVYNPAPLAFTVNLWPGLQPHRIVISSGLVHSASDTELMTVLRHELAHINRGDFWITWLAGFLRDAFFYLPTSRHLFKLLEADKEFACDEIAVLGGSHQLDLASMLIKIWENALDNSSQVQRESKWLGLFRVPGLANLQPPGKENADTTLLETRIRYLMTLSDKRFGENKQATQPRWSAYWLLAGSAFVWLSTVGMVNLIMAPFGCAIGIDLL